MVGIQAGISADHVKHVLEDLQQERWPLMPGILAAREQLSERFLSVRTRTAKSPAREGGADLLDKDAGEGRGE